MHHHSWLVTVDLGREHLDRMGLVMDFHKLKKLVNTLLEELDNSLLNDHRHFRTNNPSAENVARYIFEQLEPKLPAHVILKNVSVVEEPGCTARFAR